jgi:hypothetical protein
LAAVSRTLGPSTVKVIWPHQASEFYLQHFPAGAAYAAQTFAEASTELARIKARTRYL